MIIRLEKMIPLPMLEQDTTGSVVWEAESVLFEQGKRYIIEAPSGMGKTSLLSVIYGIRKDYQGDVYLDDSNISQFTGKSWSSIRKEKLSFIFQGLELFDRLTALENIQLKNSITRQKALPEIETMAERLDIRSFLHRKAGILSFGQQQRVAILRALCQPFDYLLADECFSHIDHENSQQAFQLIREECDRQGAGMILTSLSKTDGMEVDQRMKL
ncbi:MAG: ATP-binding cassette domain-containing protein [Bacteroidales bacterium]|nr:ATP-binding cassette domain-containing protein [Bacteroidales bacterium]